MTAEAHITYVGPAVCSGGCSQRDGRTHRDHLVFFLLADRTRGGRSGSVWPWVGAARVQDHRLARLSEDGPAKLVTRLADLLLSSSRSTPFPLLPLTLSAPSTAVEAAGTHTHRTSGCCFQSKTCLAGCLSLAPRLETGGNRWSKTVKCENTDRSVFGGVLCWTIS